MNWKLMAIEKLRRYRPMKQAIKSVTEELRQLELSACGIKSPAFAQVCAGMTASRREDQIINDLVYRQELEHAIQWANHWVKAVDSAIAALPPDEFVILSRAFMSDNYDRIDTLCDDLSLDRATYYRKRDKALERFTLGLYGKLNS